MFTASVSLFIFCLVHLSTDVSGVLKSPKMSCNLFPPLILLVFVLHMLVLLCEVHSIYYGYILLWVSSFKIMECPSLSLVTFFVLKSICLIQKLKHLLFSPYYLSEITSSINSLSDKTNSWSFDKINKIDKPLARLIKRKRNSTHINKIRNEKGKIIRLHRNTKKY